MIHVERGTEDEYGELIALDGRHALITRAIKNRQLILARKHGQTAGFLIFNQSFFEQFFIELIIVKADARQQGVGSALVRYFEKTHPDSKIFTSTNQSNLPAQAFFESLGFVKSGWIENLDADDPEIIYFKAT